MRFVPQDLDFERSPFTGLTRRHWVASAKLLIEGVFYHVANPEAPIVFPRRSRVTYPRAGAPWYELRAEEFEGLARTFLVAAPLLEEMPGLTAGGMLVRDYYARAILRACDPRSPQFVGWPEAIVLANGGKPAQQLVEMAGLCVGLMSARRAIWERYSAAEQAVVLACLQAYATARTHPHNWRFFNVLVAAFLQVQARAVDEAAMTAHLEALMAYYVGDGWYRDGAQFDYYSPWAFQFYGPLWCEWIGYEKYPELAALIERRHAELMANYPYFFGRGGESLLWGRSAIYRCAASAPLVTAFRLKHTPLDPGQARRIASGNLQQFLGREEVWQDGIPSLGFYGSSDAALQEYSCPASPFWLAKIYQALVLPTDSPFWTATENDGVWSGIGRESRTVALAGAGLGATLHGATGAAECRSGKVNFDHPLYQRLVFNTAFPWEVDDPAGVTAMTYSLRALTEEKFRRPVVTSHGGLRAGVLYRQLRFAAGDAPKECAAPEIDLAEIILPGGVLRVDRVRIPHAYELRLGHFGLPHDAGALPRVGSLPRAVTAQLEWRGLFLAGLHGWDDFGVHVHSGKNVEAATSTVLYARKYAVEVHPRPELVVTLMLHRTDALEWNEMETNPIERWSEMESSPPDNPSRIEILFKNGETRVVDFSLTEGRFGT